MRLPGYRKNAPHLSPGHSMPLLLIISALLMFYSTETCGQFRMRSANAQFEMSVSQGLDGETGSLILVNAAINYKKLVFFRRNGHFEARYRVYIDIENKDGDEPAGEVREETIVVDSYKETRSPNLRSITRRSFPAGPGEYKIKVIFEVIGTSRKYSREEKLRIVGGEEGAIHLSSPVFFVPERIRVGEKPVKGQLSFSIRDDTSWNGFVMLSGAVYADFDSYLRISSGLIFPGNGGEFSCVLTSRVTDSRGRTVSYNRQRLTTPRRHAVFCFDMNVDDLEVGFYNYSITAEIPGSGGKTSREEPFVILLNRGLFRENFPALISLLSLIADDEELKPLINATPIDRKGQWKLFWEKRDPTLSDDVNEDLGEFLRRVKYTLRAFSRTCPGWETDMGKVFIKNGTPDRITDRSGNQYAIGSNYQLWYYDSLDLVYIFQSTMGGGEYHLIDTQIY
ncbi:MAG: GWxTD domain-containing protein [Candidatus Krumholzibacteria bacterium]|nr:GWxTD domain-containing protein [Candidatus Krumholzibacteria bacterium]